jgi:hypothetical protein
VVEFLKNAATSRRACMAHRAGSPLFAFNRNILSLKSTAIGIASYGK